MSRRLGCLGCTTIMNFKRKGRFPGKNKTTTGSNYIIDSDNLKTIDDFKAVKPFHDKRK